MFHELLKEMIRHNAGDADRIQHFVKVHAFAKWIGECEGLEAKEQHILETAAYVHDIGIRPAEEKYGTCTGKMQELEGPPVAREMLARLGFDEDVIQRVCYLVGHHHTYTDIDGLDYQILVEADFLVNLYENGNAPETIAETRDKIFKTESGKRLCDTMFFGTQLMK